MILTLVLIFILSLVAYDAWNSRNIRHYVKSIASTIYEQQDLQVKGKQLTELPNALQHYLGQISGSQGIPGPLRLKIKGTVRQNDGPMHPLEGRCFYGQVPSASAWYQDQTHGFMLSVKEYGCFQDDQQDYMCSGWFSSALGATKYPLHYAGQRILLELPWHPVSLLDRNVQVEAHSEKLFELGFVHLPAYGVILELNEENLPIMVECVDQRQHFRMHYHDYQMMNGLLLPRKAQLQEHLANGITRQYIFEVVEVAQGEPMAWW